MASPMQSTFPVDPKGVGQSGNINDRSTADVSQWNNKHKAKAKRRVSKSAYKKAKPSQHKKRKCLHPLCYKIDFLRGMKEIMQFLSHFYSQLSREYYNKFYPEYTSHPEARDEMAHKLYMSLSDLDVICRIVSLSYQEDIDTKIKYSVRRTDFLSLTPKLDNFQTIPTCRCSYGLYLSRVNKKRFTEKDGGKTVPEKSDRVGRRGYLHRNEQFYRAIHEIDKTFGTLSI